MILQPNELEEPLSVPKIFGREGPLEIEIGMGKGRFLRERAAVFPERNYLGIEKSGKWLRHAVERFEKAGLSQIRVAQVYVEGFLERYIVDDSVLAYHIYFPDPWPKKRHHKRRLIQPPLIQQLFRTLKDEGEVNIATDYLDYYHYISDVLSTYSRNHFQINFQAEPFSFQSNYQVKYLNEGRPLYFVQAVRNRRCKETDYSPAAIASSG